MRKILLSSSLLLSVMTAQDLTFDNNFTKAIYLVTFDTKDEAVEKFKIYKDKFNYDYLDITENSSGTYSVVRRVNESENSTALLDDIRHNFSDAWLVNLAKVKNMKSVEIYSKDIDSSESRVIATGDVVVLQNGQYIQSDRAIYDKNSSQIELFGNVMAIDGDNFQAISNYAKVNTSTNEKHFAPFYMLSQQSKIWVSSKEAQTCNNDFNLTSGIVSGCDPTNPLWKIDFSSSKYNDEEKWLELYNARLSFFDYSVFYTPYIAFPLDNNRHTGLLVPKLGLSSNEGFYYEQPIYIAEEENWDLELLPQVRTNRGYGLYGKLRFKDSKESYGEFDFGYFNEQQDYAKEYNLANDKDYGFGLDYYNSNLFKNWFGADFEGQSGLYSSIDWMNNVEYINLSTNDTTKSATTSQIESRINLFYGDDKNYYGLYFKYFRDLNLDTNSATLQQLPGTQYHRYLETFLDDKIYSNLDLNINYLYRQEGKKALQTELDLPVTFQTSMFDDFLDLSYGIKTYARHINFSGSKAPADTSTEAYNSGTYFRYNHLLSAGTHLSKGYEDFVHTISFSADYIKRGSESKNGFYKENRDKCSLSSTLEECQSFYNLTNVEDNTQFNFTQYMYDNEGNEFLYHRLSQRVNYDVVSERLGELENEIRYAITSSLNYYNDTFYNYQRDRVTKIVNALTFDDSEYVVSLNHIYSDQLINNSAVYSSYVTLDTKYRYSKNYEYNAKIAYDYSAKVKKNFEVGLLYSKRCWDFGVKYIENNRPILSTSGASSVYDRYIYFTIALKPFGSSEFMYKVDDK